MVEKLKQNPGLRDLLSHQILNDLILIVPMDFYVEGGVVRPAQYEDKPEYGVVLKVGQGRLLDSGERVPPSVKEGDFIIYGKYSSTVVRAEGVDFFFIHEEDIMSRYEG